MAEEKNALNVLIVDDEENIRSSFKRLFRRLRTLGGGVSYDFLEAESGSQAMTILDKKDVDCILLDYKMPGGDGIEWLKKILAQDKARAVVMLTGEGNEQIAVDAMKNGAMDYLVKGSLRIEQLERAVLNAIERVRLLRAIKKQREDLIHAERQRVMIESLGAACHHLGQPLTIITMYLELMKRDETSPETLRMINECKQEAGAISDIMVKLMQVSEYRTEPYRLDGGERILRI